MTDSKDELLQKEIKDLRNNLTTDRLDMSYGEILSMYNNCELIIAPAFQRLFRWSNYQKTRFIESILLGIPTPPIFVAEDEEGKWELVDGLQRLSTILSFFGMLKNDEHKNNWILEKADLIENLEGYNSKDLPLIFTRNIKRAYCRVEIIKWDSKLDMRYELFNRLNTGGSILTEQEIRNCIFRGSTDNFNNFLSEMASNSKFIELVDISKRKIDELYLEELVLRFTALYKSIDDMDNNLSTFLTDYMKKVTTGRESLNFSEIKEIFEEIINMLYDLNDKNIFKGENSQFSSSFYDGIMIGLASNLEKYRNDKMKLSEKIDILKNCSDFAQYMGTNSGGKTRVENRIKIAKEIFEKKDE